MKVKSGIIAPAAILAILAIAAGAWMGCGKKEEDKQTLQNGVNADTADTQLPAVEPQSTEVEQPRPKPTVTMTEEGNYTVQVSSWRSSANARRDAERYKAQGFDAYVQTADIPSKGGTWHRVRVGRFATKEEAEQLTQELQGMLEAGYWIDEARQ